MRPGTAGQIVMALAFLVLSVRGADAWVLASLTGDWSASVGTLELTGAAGSDFAPTLESPVDVATLEIESTSDWRVDVSRAGASWPSTLSISVLASSVKTRGNGSSIWGSWLLLLALVRGLLRIWQSSYIVPRERKI